MNSRCRISALLRQRCQWVAGNRSTRGSKPGWPRKRRLKRRMREAATALAQGHPNVAVELLKRFPVTELPRHVALPLILVRERAMIALLARGGGAPMPSPACAPSGSPLSRSPALTEQSRRSTCHESRHP